MQKQFLSIRWGKKYGPEYVNRLYGMVARNVTGDFTFHCVTDSPDELRPEVNVIPLPEMGCEMPRNTNGIWGKSRLWLPGLGGLSGPVLFMDLDLVVTGTLDGFFEVGSPDDVILARNPNTPLEKLGQTSIFRYPIGKLAPLREKFLANPQGVADEYRYEQRFVTRNAPGGISFWPQGWVAHFRHHLIPPFPMNYLRVPQLRPENKVVIFPGSFNPPDAIAGRWNEADPVRSPGQHILAAFSGKRREGFVRHLRHFVLPTPWVARYWQE